MVMSKATSPHAFSVVEVDFATGSTTRSKLKGKWKASEGFSLTYLPFIARALIDGLGEFPHLNASVVDDSLVVHNYIDLGIAVDLQYEGSARTCHPQRRRPKQLRASPARSTTSPTVPAPAS